MNRRRFLKGAGFAGLLALLQACRLAGFGRTPVAQVSTSIPTDTPTRLPSLTPTGTGTPALPGTATPTSAASATAAATATATPALSPGATPTWTPVPTLTPYPPGPPTKLGLFITRYEPKVLQLVAEGKPALIKTLEIDSNYVKGIKDSSPTTLIVGRLHLDQLNLDIDPLPQAYAFVEELLPLANDATRMAAFDAWESYNEPVADTPDKMKRLADFEAERTRLLAENGIRSVVGNFATGHPPLELWPDFKAALDAIRQYNGYLGLHEYSAPVMQFLSGALQLHPEDPDQGDEGWLTLRYRKAYRQFLAPMGFGDIPLLITECGVDGLVQPRPGPDDAEGWLDFVDTWIEDYGQREDGPGVYMDQLIWYDQNLQQDEYVKGAAIFLAGSNVERWWTYDVLDRRSGHMADLLLQYFQAHPPA